MPIDETRPAFIDVFAGAGGLSLGLLQAGWTGLFAVEKSPMAFETLKHNLVDPKDGPRFDWPAWLPQKAIDIQTLLDTYPTQLQELQGLPLLAGGPPCQGFSTAGRRRHDDVRNRLFEQYLDLVRLLLPQILLLENVREFATTFTRTEKGTNGIAIQENAFNADDELRAALDAIGYTTFPNYGIMAKDFGVPQLRPRYIIVAIRKDLVSFAPAINPSQLLKDARTGFLAAHGLPTDRDVTLSEAISDLEKRHRTVPCIEHGMRRFQQGRYGPTQGEYQALMRLDRQGHPIERGRVADSHRFPNHTQAVIDRFKFIMRTYRRGIQLNNAEREELKLNKHRIGALAPNEVSHTLTSLPDDLIHYGEPRIFTVREYARIQSFPDWFRFKSKYTTGGDLRRFEIPRYTQVANAVPPLLAEAFGGVLLHVLAVLRWNVRYTLWRTLVQIASTEYDTLEAILGIELSVPVGAGPVAPSHIHPVYQQLELLPTS